MIAKKIDSTARQEINSTQSPREWLPLPIGSNWVRLQLEGAKNHPVRSGYQGRRKIYIASYNTSTLSKEQTILELEEELQQIHWNVVRLREIRRRGEEQIVLKSGNTFYFRENEERSDGGSSLHNIQKASE